MIPSDSGLSSSEAVLLGLTLAVLFEVGYCLRASLVLLMAHVNASSLEANETDSDILVEDLS